MANWQKVYCNSNPIQAEIVKSILEARGFAPVLVNKIDPLYNGALGGECEIYVSPEYVIPSIKIIQDEIKFE